MGHSLGGMVAYASLMSPDRRVVRGRRDARLARHDGRRARGDRPLGAVASPASLRAGADSVEAFACAGAPFAGILATNVLPTLIRDWFWHPDNFDIGIVRFMMSRGVEDLPRSLLIEFARWYEAKRMSDRYDLFSFGDHLERIEAPVFVIAGSRDRLTPPADLERLVARWARGDKSYFVAGHASGLDHEYSHVDLVLGRHAPDEIYPRVTEWLDAHRPGRRAGRRVAIGDAPALTQGSKRHPVPGELKGCSFSTISRRCPGGWPARRSGRSRCCCSGSTNQRLGISTGFENLCALVVRTPYFRRAEIAGSNGWRLPFLGGLVLGGVLSAATSGGWQPFWELGMFDTTFGWGPAGKLALDVRRRALHRLRHAAGRRLHQRSRHLRHLEPGARQRRVDARLHGRRHRHDEPDLPGAGGAR